MKTNNNLKYDYSELDKFITEDSPELQDLAEGFREFHCVYTNAITHLANINLTDTEKGEFYIPSDAAVYVGYFEQLFRILEEMKENPEYDSKAKQEGAEK